MKGEPTMSDRSIVAQIMALDPVRDHQRIVFLSKCYDFAFDTTRALEFALYRTYSVPGISGLLDAPASSEGGRRSVMTTPT
jgi:hypothetical protein